MNALRRMASFLMGVGWWWILTISVAFNTDVPVYLVAAVTGGFWVALIVIIGLLCERFKDRENDVNRFRLSTMILITVFCAIHFSIARFSITHMMVSNPTQELQFQDWALWFAVFGAFVFFTTLLQILFGEALITFINLARRKSRF